MELLEGIIFQFAAIFVGAAFLSSFFLYTKQPMILAYIAVGAIAGPAGFALISDTEQIHQMSRVGVILLLFLVGLDLQPMKLMGLFRQSSVLTLSTSFLFGGISLGFALLVGLGRGEAAIFGTAMMFSSTVIGLKLVPTSTLHQKRAGELMTSVLIVQDILAILAILFITGEKADTVLMMTVLLLGKFLLLCAAAFLGVRFVVFPLLVKFDAVQEYTLVLTLGWCLFCAEAARHLGLSHEMGAFIGGLAMASHAVAPAIAHHLKPLREFFLILFFFAVGAEFNFRMPSQLLAAGLLFGAALVFIKSFLFRAAFARAGETPRLSMQLGDRLGQASEFSFLIAFAAVSAGAISERGELLIQAATISTFVISTYWVVSRYPTPISMEAPFRRD